MPSLPGSGIPLFGVILAGGSGTRFWPLSRSLHPKQVLRLLGSQSMLEATIRRLLPRIPLERLGVVTSISQADIIRLELYRHDWAGIKVWLEPQGKNTAAAVGLAAVLLAGEPGADTLAVFPADHFIRDQPQLHAALDRGAALAQEGYLVTFGINPTRAETGYGYIKAGQPLGDGLGFRAERFIEKPPAPQAGEFLAAGGYFWNSGIFVFRRQVFLDAMARLLPETFAGLAALGEDPPSRTLQEIYQDLPSISLDHGVMEKAENVAVVPVDMGWSDVGTWGALYDLFTPNERGNVLLGRTLDRDSQGTLVYAQDRLVATLGLKDVIVAETADALLVCHRDRVQEVKDLAAEVARQHLAESLQHPTVERPWGRYTILDVGPDYQVKQLVVAPGKRLSLQLHRHRAEHWVVVQGTALVTIGSETKEVVANQSVYVPLETPHRLENPGPEPLKLIEVQTGSYLGEDDIVRLADDFWRQPGGQET
jgi:mannose-1-phosphate guanylyltransferase/mannose-6-phosphate isomerase